MQWELFAAAATSPAQRVPCLRRESEVEKMNRGGFIVVEKKKQNTEQHINSGYLLLNTHAISCVLSIKNNNNNNIVNIRGCEVEQQHQLLF